MWGAEARKNTAKKKRHTHAESEASDPLSPDDTKPLSLASYEPPSLPTPAPPLPYYRDNEGTPSLCAARVRARYKYLPPPTHRTLG